MKTIKEKRQLGLLCRIKMNINMLNLKLKKQQQAAFLKKTILNMFKL